MNMTTGINASINAGVNTSHTSMTCMASWTGGTRIGTKCNRAGIETSISPLCGGTGSNTGIAGTGLSQ